MPTQDFKGTVSGVTPVAVVEETWTITLTPQTSGSITLNASYNTGYYTRIGNRVFISGVAYVQSVNAPVGALYMNLPIPAGAAGTKVSALAIHAETLNATATGSIQAYILSNSSNVIIDKFAAGTTSALSADIKAGTDIDFSGSYVVD